MPTSRGVRRQECRRYSRQECLRYGRGIASQAFSLIEILVTVAILSVIILGLVAMFNQTRRAFTSSMTQVDVLESGRSAADLLSRELEQVSAVLFGVRSLQFVHHDAE